MYCILFLIVSSVIPVTWATDDKTQAQDSGVRPSPCRPLRRRNSIPEDQMPGWEMDLEPEYIADEVDMGLQPVFVQQAQPEIIIPLPDQEQNNNQPPNQQPTIDNNNNNVHQILTLGDMIATLGTHTTTSSSSTSGATSSTSSTS